MQKALVKKPIVSTKADLESGFKKNADQCPLVIGWKYVILVIVTIKNSS